MLAKTKGRLCLAGGALPIVLARARFRFFHDGRKNYLPKSGKHETLVIPEPGTTKLKDQIRTEGQAVVRPLVEVAGALGVAGFFANSENVSSQNRGSTKPCKPEIPKSTAPRD